MGHSDTILKRFDQPDETRVFEKGKLDVLKIGGMTVARARYEPGWKWSEHVGKALGKDFCDVEHVGMVVSGCATAAYEDGAVVEMRAGDVFHVRGRHDSWVIGDEPYVSIHFVGGEDYAKR